MSIVSGNGESFQEKVVSLIGLVEGNINWPIDNLIDVKAWLADSSDLAAEAEISYNLQTKSVTYTAVELSEVHRQEVANITRQLDREKQLSDQVDVSVELVSSYRLVKA